MCSSWKIESWHRHRPKQRYGWNLRESKLTLTMNNDQSHNIYWEIRQKDGAERNLHGSHIYQQDDQVVQMSHHSSKSTECLDRPLLLHCKT